MSVRAIEGLGAPRDADFYLCGPAVFMTDLTAWGVTADHIHTESFGSGVSMTAGVAAAPHLPPHLPAGPASAGPLVSFARSGLNVHWGSTLQNLLALAEACDVPVRWSCHTGDCAIARPGSSPALSATDPTPARPEMLRKSRAFVPRYHKFESVSLQR